MSLICKQLHELVQRLPEASWPFELDQLPQNGVYFFYEQGEAWGHGGGVGRIVRVGTHREGNFRTRMADHYVVNDRKMNFTREKAAPKDRSIFRKNIGRALLNRDRDPYLAVWELDFTTRDSLQKNGFRRDIEKELEIEQEVTRILRERFTFRYVEVAGQNRRMGTSGLEATFIGTLASCSCCTPSPNWLGRFSSKPKIVQRGLWLEQHLKAAPLTETAFSDLEIFFEPGGR